ncbi:C4-dicarboxylate transporter DctA [Sphingomonas sp. MMSM24]|uniref:C4-dicarboxylate transporter DctA n=2 Tax=Sphingomonas lycopersici TaxID=2951807 RepID=A0AA42CSG1_9SPHN|nr:C4-dicarboxylate transporter DctA [Sphingomonas lycopersici]
MLGVALGHFAPDTGAALRPLGELFIKLVRMMIAPIVFVTVVTGIAGLGNLREAGRLGFKAILYFELVSTLALVIGLVVGNLVQPGHGLNIDPRSLDSNAVASFVRAGEQMSSVGFLFHMVPDSLLGALASGEILQVLLVAILLGAVLAGSGQGDGAIVRLLEEAGKALFGMIGAIMYLAPVGAFGAMAFTVGKYGVGALQQLGMLIVCFYATALIFIVGVLGLIARASGFSLWRLLVYLKDEIVLVLGTSTSESALPRLMEKLERLGVARPVVRLVVPTGYSFNLDGIAIYLTMASLFIAQALNVPLSIGEQIGLLLVLLLTSKGAAAVTGGGFITLAATLSSTHTLPVAGLALLLGIDRFMSEARAITNMIGNAVACLAVARWEGAVDQQRMRSMLHGGDLDASTR